MIVSAMLDGELSSGEKERVGGALHRDEALRESMDRYSSVRHALRRVPPGEPDDADVADAAERVRARVERTVRIRPMHPPWWRVTVSLPVPVLSAAVAIILVLSGVVAMTLFDGSTAASVESPGLAGMDASDRRINVQVNVDAGHTDQLLQWLNEHAHSQQVTVQLPEQAQFQLRGDPVLLRRSPDAADESDEMEIVPLEVEED